MKTLLLFLVFIPGFLIGQNEITSFKTFDDFKNDNGVKSGVFTGEMQHVMGRVTLFVEIDGEKQKFKCENYWGYVYKDEVYRITEEGVPVILISTKGIHYYENGTAYMKMQLYNRTEGSATVLTGYFCYISHELNSTILPATSQYKSKLKKFAKKHPEHLGLVECFNENRKELLDSEIEKFLESTRSCVNNLK